MPGFSNEVTRATTDLGLDPSPVRGLDNFVPLNRGIDALARRDMPLGAPFGPGGVLWFPPGAYVLEPPSTRVEGRVHRPHLYVPDNIVLWFSPGARLVLARDFVLDIEGEIDAGLYPIFSSGPESGVVVFSGQRVGKVHPEWWGAVGDGVHDDTDAVQAAIDAASNHRHVYSVASSEVFLPPIPVHLTGSYAIRRALKVGLNRESFTVGADPATLLGDPLGHLHGDLTPRASTLACHLRGNSGLASEAGPHTLRWLGTPAGGPAMVYVRGSFSPLIEDVSFATAPDTAVDACLALEGSLTTRRDLDPPSAVMEQGVVRRCSLRGARRRLLRVGPAPRIRRVPKVASRPSEDLVDVSATRTGDDLVNLVLDGCLFEPAEGARAVEVHAENTLPMELRSCVFRGGSSGMVRFHSGSGAVLACTFDNSQQDGLDLHLDTEAASGPSVPVPGESAMNYAHPVPGSLTVVHGVSLSRQLFGTFEGDRIFNRRSNPIGNSLLVGLLHRPRVVLERDVAVFWDQPRYSGPFEQPPHHGLGITTVLGLCGVRLGGDVRINSVNAVPVASIHTTFWPVHGFIRPAGDSDRLWVVPVRGSG